MMASSAARDALSPHRLRTYRRGEGMTVLCLHGHPGSGASMSVFTDFLSHQFQTLSPDLRGYGRSRYPQPFPMEAHLSDLQALLDREEVQTCLILGWSLGGILALELALRLPQRVKGLMLVATAARPRGNHPPITLSDQVYTGVASLVNRISPGWGWNIETFGKRSLYRHLMQQHSSRAYEYLAYQALPAYLQTSSQASQALSSALRKGYNRLSDIQEIKTPCLVLAGEQDRHITAQSSLETARALPDSRFIAYPDVAHLFPWEIPDAVEADISAWLSEQSFGASPDPAI
ncbi:MAG: alpha/beta fold hydrolase [Elainellaceae cyanobacterium]